MKTFAHVFWNISQLIWMKFGRIPQPIGLLKLMLNLFHMIAIQGREIC